MRARGSRATGVHATRYTVPYSMYPTPVSCRVGHRPLVVWWAASLVIRCLGHWPTVLVTLGRVMCTRCPRGIYHYYYYVCVHVLK